jgi:hypothetical protein
MEMARKRITVSSKPLIQYTFFSVLLLHTCYLRWRLGHSNYFGVYPLFFLPWCILFAKEEKTYTEEKKEDRAAAGAALK